jgi:hypothetical protein
MHNLIYILKIIFFPYNLSKYMGKIRQNGTNLVFFEIQSREYNIVIAYDL